MRSQLDGEIPEYSLARRGGSSKGPWLLSLLSLAAAGTAGWFFYAEHGERGAAQARADSFGKKLREAEAAAKELAAKLEAAVAEKAQLSKNVQSKDEELQKLKAAQAELSDKLKAELSSGDVSLTEDGGKLRVGLVDKVLFNSGEAQINKRGEGLLVRLGSILGGVTDRQILVSGHTDQTPIGEKRSAKFPSNWELSVARATTVVRFLQEKAGVPGERLVASGYGEYHPVASNKSSSGRARNRRIEILLTPTIAPKAIEKSRLKQAEAHADGKAAKRSK